MEATKKYFSPQIEVIELDNYTSLILMSSPPEGPEETALNIETFGESNIC